MALDIASFLAAVCLLAWAVRMWNYDSIWATLSLMVAALVIVALLAVNFAGFDRDFGLGDEPRASEVAPGPASPVRQPSR